MRNVLISHTTILAARMSITVGFAECIPIAQTQTNEGYERCEVLTAVLINIRVLWDMTTCLPSVIFRVRQEEVDIFYCSEERGSNVLRNVDNCSYKKVQGVISQNI